MIINAMWDWILEQEKTLVEKRMKSNKAYSLVNKIVPILIS